MDDVHPPRRRRRTEHPANTVQPRQHVADVARDAIARGLPLMRDAKRKRRRNGPRKRGGNGGGNGPDAGGA